MPTKVGMPAGHQGEENLGARLAAAIRRISAMMNPPKATARPDIIGVDPSEINL
jgi:hypothetical protein